MREFLQAVGGLAIIVLGIVATAAAVSGRVSRLVLCLAGMVTGAALVWGPVDTWQSVGTTAAGWIGDLVG